MPRENRLKGKVAIITGAASGIGDATVTLFTEQGAKVVANDVPGSALKDRHGANPHVVCVDADLTDDDAPQMLVDKAVEEFGGIDILFNNAGICPSEPYEQQDPETFKRVMDVNLHAVNRLTLAALPQLKKSGSGRIINTGSVQSELAGEMLTAYTSSKHALAGLTKQQALELGEYGIAANYIQPGFIVTGISQGYLDQMNEEEAEAFKAYWRGKAPVGRLGQPIDVAYAALFLSIDASNFISGTGLKVDGGATIKL